MDSDNSLQSSDNNYEGESESKSESESNSSSSSSKGNSSHNSYTSNHRYNRRLIANDPAVTSSTHQKKKTTQTSKVPNITNTNNQRENKKKKNNKNNNNNNNENDDEKINLPQKNQNQNPLSRSKLAREHKISAIQEQEIQDVFLLFARDSSLMTNTSSLNTDKVSSSSLKRKRINSESKRQVSQNKRKKDDSSNIQMMKLPIINLRPALIALSLTPTTAELNEFIAILDSEGTGLVEYEPFVAICALKINSRVVGDTDHQREVDEAWELFVREGEDRITLASLREVARGIGEKDISDDLLRDMVLEANEGAGLAKGVNKREFENVMRKAGVWRSR
ncbi:putative ef-hand superfamily ca2+-modulated protein [Erysiphe necator]|uniref:Putative ef-hand superfamily ca2+-modulated protein n=1 Tax=Uncinula necator TaxID=52586 RepID=A0A0B1P189_UNCNE|nr:putative ef-hand superfamily ca2+-modulated protein [Erysiphe necator]